jgi:hypothetical protein
MLAAGGLVALHSFQSAPGAGAQVVTLDPAKRARIFGAQFHSIPVGNGARPVLPDGRAGVSLDQAVATAVSASPAVGIASRAGHLLANVQAQGSYGTITLAHEGRRLASGQISPDIQGRPAWIIVFSGPGVLLGPSGPPGTTGPVHHELDVVVDAATGQYLRAYSYR